MRLDEAAAKSFARHETFHPRFGWAKKAVDGAASSDDLFNRDDAVVDLGVGKNMVRSIRYWGLAYKLLEAVKADGERLVRVNPSPIGALMLGEDGLDPYAERPGTAWLLHWLLLAPRSLAPSWWIAFQDFPQLEFEEEQLVEYILERTQIWSPQETTVRKDVSCLVRMYVGGGGGRQTFDDMIDCPSRELNLISSTATRGRYRFVLGEKPTLPPEIAALACLDFMARTSAGSSTSTLSKLVVEPGSPGRAFRLSEGNLLDLLRHAAEQHGGLALGAAAGAPQLVVRSTLGEAAAELLTGYYGKNVADASAFVGWGSQPASLDLGEA